MKTRKRELVRELLFSKSFSGKVKHRVKKELRDRATDELTTICIFHDRLRNDLRKKNKVLLFIIARRRERAKRAFFLYLPREIARRNRNEEKRSVRAQNDLKRNARRRRTQTSLSLSLGFRSFAVSFVVKGHSRRERIIYLRGVGLLQRGKRHAIRFYIKENRSVMV